MHWPHLSRHVGAVPVEIVVLPVEGDVVAAPVDGAGAVAQGLGARPAPSLAGAEESGKGAWRGRRGPGLPRCLEAARPCGRHGDSPTSSARARPPRPRLCGPPCAPPTPAKPDHVPGVAIHLDLVPGGVHVLVVHTRALVLLDAAATAVIQQPVRAHTAADAHRLILRGRTAGFRPPWPSRLSRSCPSSRTADTPLSLAHPTSVLSLSRAHHWPRRQARAAGQGSPRGPEPSMGWAGTPGAGRAEEAHACAGPGSQTPGPVRKPASALPRGGPPHARGRQPASGSWWAASSGRSAQSGCCSPRRPLGPSSLGDRGTPSAHWTSGWGASEDGGGGAAPTYSGRAA